MPDVSTGFVAGGGPLGGFGILLCGGPLGGSPLGGGGILNEGGNTGVLPAAWAGGGGIVNDGGNTGVLPACRTGGTDEDFAGGGVFGTLRPFLPWSGGTGSDCKTAWNPIGKGT